MLIWNVVENTKSRRSSLKLDFARKPTKESDFLQKFYGNNINHLRMKIM